MSYGGLNRKQSSDAMWVSSQTSCLLDIFVVKDFYTKFHENLSNGLATYSHKQMDRHDFLVLFL